MRSIRTAQNSSTHARKSPNVPAVLGGMLTFTITPRRMHPACSKEPRLWSRITGELDLREVADEQYQPDLGLCVANACLQCQALDDGL